MNRQDLLAAIYEPGNLAPEILKEAQEHLEELCCIDNPQAAAMQARIAERQIRRFAQELEKERTELTEKVKLLEAEKRLLEVQRGSFNDLIDLTESQLAKASAKVKRYEELSPRLAAALFGLLAGMLLGNLVTIAFL